MSAIDLQRGIVLGLRMAYDIAGDHFTEDPAQILRAIDKERYAQEKRIAKEKQK